MRGWLPDGLGLGPEATDLLAKFGGRVHLRLRRGDEYPRAACACDASLGEWWTGVASEVTCPACLEVVHA